MKWIKIRQKCGLLVVGIIFLVLTISFVSAAERLPAVGGDSDSWGTILNEFLNVSLNESGEIRPANLTFAQKVTFAFGEVIDNIIDGWIRITGGLNVTGDVEIGGNLDVSGNVTINGVPLSNHPSKVNLTTTTHAGNLTNGSYVGYAAGNTICSLEYLGSHMCDEFEITQWFAGNGGMGVTGDAWINAGGPKYVPASIPVNDCNGWTHGEAGTYLGNYWHFNTTSGGDGRAINCGTALSLACCTY